MDNPQADPPPRGPTTSFGLRVVQLMHEQDILTQTELAQRLRDSEGFPSLSTVQAVIRGNKPPSREFVERIFVCFRHQDESEWLTLAGLTDEPTEADLADAEAERLATKLAGHLRRLLGLAPVERDALDLGAMRIDAGWDAVHEQAEGLCCLREKYGADALKADPARYPIVCERNLSHEQIQSDLAFFEALIREDQHWDPADPPLFPASHTPCPKRHSTS